MAVQELQGRTLGEKHRFYNDLVKEAIKNNNKVQPGDFKAEDNDISNLIKIDVASKQRNVDFILKILQCNDMLYVSRAIKQNPWLITDRQYSHIINPKYLHNHLFPHMISKACSKLMLHIRLNLKDEDRVEDFYNFLKEKDIQVALSWLPHCSLSLVEKEVQKYHENLGISVYHKESYQFPNIHLLKVLCEKSITILDVYIKVCRYDIKDKLMNKTMFVRNTNAEKYLDIVESLDERVKFGPKATRIFMKTCPERIIKNFEKYFDRVDLQTFAKHVKTEGIKGFLSKMLIKEELKHWFVFDNLRHFMRFLPKEGRFEFLKKIIEQPKIDDETTDDDVLRAEVEEKLASRIGFCSTQDSFPLWSSENIYRWYRFAPFDLAFPELIKLIIAESRPNERVSMFGVLLHCAGRNQQHVKTLLQYYCDKHANEPFKFKIHFINMLLSKTDTYKFDKSTWELLNNLFHSLEVYIESEHKVQSCIEAIILYKLLHNESVPETIEKKFEFNSMSSIQMKLTDEEKEKVFDYLYQYQVKKIQSRNISSESEFKEAVQILEDIQVLLKDWKKNLADCPWYLEKVRELINIKNTNDWKTSFKNLYLQNKLLRRAMFEESILIYPSDETCYNSLKHDPQLMSRYKSTMQQIQRDDSVSLRRLLRALRIYWPQTLASEWTASYLDGLNQLSGHKALISGLCTLASQSQLIEIIREYAPTDSKIDWNGHDKRILSLRKNLARNMYLSRPAPSVDLVLLYAKGNYLQFALPSLNSVVYNMSATQTREHLAKILNAPVSLQKHGIRYAFTKLEPEELKQVFHDIWIKVKNPSIRAVLSKQTFDFLCKQKKHTVIEDIWELLSMCFDDLLLDVNKIIYVILIETDEVPLLVRGKFFQKSLKFLKSLPANADMECNINSLMYVMKNFIELLDPEFVGDVLKESLNKDFTSKTYKYTELLAVYLLCSKDIESQTKRYSEIFLPVLESSFALWDKKMDDGCYVSRNVIEVLKQLFRCVPKFVFDKRMIFPTKMFSDIQEQLEKTLTSEQHYRTRTTWKLITTFIKILETQKDALAICVPVATEQQPLNLDYYDTIYTDRWDEFYFKAIPQFSEMCLLYLREDIKKYFPSIYWIFAKCLDNIFRQVHILVYLEFFWYFLKDEEFIPSYLIMLNNINYCSGEKGVIKKIKEIRRKIFSHPSLEVKLHYYKTYDRHNVEESAENATD